MRGELMHKILDLLEDKSIGVLDFFDIFLGASYGTSIGKFEYEFNKKTEKRLDYQVRREKRRKLQKYISKLKTEGFISESSSGKIALTDGGKKKLTTLKNRKILDKNSYKKEIGDNVIIISYDIPIIFNRERDILRDILKMLGFNMVHKSVWVGKVKLPKQFIIALEKLGILNYIEILEVTKSGTLKPYN